MLLLSGRPSDDPLHVDFVPSVFAYRPNTRKRVVKQNRERYLRSEWRRQVTEQQEAVAHNASKAAEVGTTDRYSK